MNFTANYKLQQDLVGVAFIMQLISTKMKFAKYTALKNYLLCGTHSAVMGEGFSRQRISLCCNGTESLNKVFKYHYLPRKKKMMLSSIITLIVEVFLPESYQKYLFLNYKQSSQYRTYNAFVRDYLHGRPKAVISHCLERRSKAMKYTTEEITVLDDKNGIFSVRGTSGKDHSVTFALPSCSCRDWTTWHLPCKHFFGIFSNCPKWNWNSLPENYLTGAYLSTDRSAIADFFQPSVEADLVTDSVVPAQPTALPKIPESKVRE